MISEHKVSLVLNRGLKPEVCNKRGTAVRRPPTARKKDPQQGIPGTGKTSEITVKMECHLCSIQDTECLGLVHGDDPER